MLIDVALERELREHPDIDCFKRVGITAEQVEAYDLPSKPRKGKEKRAKHITETVEAEAMPAAMMRDPLRNEIEELLPPDALKVAKVKEESERAWIDQATDGR